MTEVKKKPSGAAALAKLGLAVGTPQTDPNNKTFLFYGPSGVGKTRLAASASRVGDLSRVLLVDIESGSASIEGVYTDNIDVVRPQNYADLKNVFEFVLNEEHDYQTVIVDTVGEQMELMGNEYEERNPHATNKYEKWELMAKDTIKWTKLLHKSGLCVIILAHTDEKKDEKTGRVTTFPYFLGQKTGKEAPKVFDVIGYLYATDHPEDADKTIRVLQTEGDEGRIAKDRTDSLPAHMGNPDMKKIYDRIASGVKGKPD